MNPYERIYNRLSGFPVDRAPNLNILMMFAAKYINASYDKYCTDYRVLVEANLKCNELFGIDMLNTMSDPLRETSDFGAKIEYPFDSLPVCREHFIKETTDISKLMLFDPLKSKRMYDRIKAIELYKKEAYKHYSILGWVEGPFAETCDLRGINEVMMDIYDETKFVEEMMEICCEQAIRCAKAQIDAGADFIGIGDAAVSLLGPKMYKDLVFPKQKKLISEIHMIGGKVKLHICGNISNIIADMGDTGADIIDVDYAVDFKFAINTLRGKCSANGNIDPVRGIYYASEKDIFSEVTKCLDVSDEYTFISGGCEIPKDTAIENLITFSKALNR